MADRLTTCFQLIDLSVDRWRTEVGNPYLESYTVGYTQFTKTLDEQKEEDKQAGEFFIAAASICTGSLLAASIAKATLSRLGRRSLILIGGRQLATTYRNLYTTVSGFEPATFAIGKVYEALQGKLKDRAKESITEALQRMSRIVSPEPLVRVLQMDTLLRTHVIAAKETAQAIEADHKTNDSEKNALYDKLRQAPLANKPQVFKSPLPGTLAEKIELTFYLGKLLDSDELITWPASTANEYGYSPPGKSVPIQELPSSPKYPHPAVPKPTYTALIPEHQSVGITRPGGRIQNRIDELCKKIFNAPFYGQNFGGPWLRDERLKPGELLKAEQYLDKLADVTRPRAGTQALIT